jgi:hypothetical protein
MKKVFKWAIESGEPIEMQEDAEILSLQMQHGVPCLWALVDPEKPHINRLFCVYGTGHEIDEPVGKYIGTFQQCAGAFVFHVFEKEVGKKK